MKRTVSGSVSGLIGIQLQWREPNSEVEVGAAVDALSPIDSSFARPSLLLFFPFSYSSSSSLFLFLTRKGEGAICRIVVNE